MKPHCLPRPTCGAWRRARESRWRTGPGGLRVHSRIAPDVVMLGAIDAWDPERARREYQDFGGIVWPMRLTAKSESGAIDVRLRDPEFNTEPPPGAFNPPRRAKKLE